MIELNQSLQNDVKKIAIKAGQAILDIYQQGSVEIDTKGDQSPLTQADLASHNIIIKALKKLTPGIPILSEEGEILKDDAHTFWCVDPLDGTKEFIKRNGEFTVNIALIEKNQPVLGVIYIPLVNEIFMAMKDRGVFKIKDNKTNQLQHLQNSKLRQPPIFAVSRSHLNQRTQDFINYHKAETIAAGSSLKLTLLAEGIVDAYPRFGPTSLWDIAAGHCIIKEVGCEIFTLNKKPLSYNLNHLLNEDFIAIKSPNRFKEFL